MAKDKAAKAGWGQKVVLLLAAAAVAGAAWIVYLGSVKKPDLQAVVPGEAFAYSVTPLQLGDRIITLQIADSADKQQLGLGKRSKLSPDRGMVFTYPNEQQRCFWMKDMNFPIDIIWLDGMKLIVTIESDLKPETYPKTFCPDKSAQYVIELRPGTAKATGMKAGQTLDFQTD